jgi:N utilization substance protein A
VIVKAIAREAGVRTKIAVDSTQSGVDPVGSCVGQKGVRVQEVINELNNEKIDIIQYTANEVEFLRAALAPAEKLEITLDTTHKLATVAVPEDQLSLAIGRGGQNVRLAAKLTGYKINIQGSGGQQLSVTGSEEYEIDQLGLKDSTREILVEAKISSILDLEKAMDSLADIEGMTATTIKEVTKKLDEFKQVSSSGLKPKEAEKEAPVQQEE